MGKTTEFRAQSTKCRQAGGFTFFCELVTLADQEFKHALDPDDDGLIAEWRSSTRDAIFFLDSLDEAKLRGKTLRRALANLRRGLGDDWARARLVVSSRDSDWLPSDLQDLERAIGFGESPLVASLEPLERDQFEMLAQRAGVSDLSALWQAIQDQSAQDFAARPADAIWIAEYWAEKRQIVDLTDLIDSNLEKRCRERPDRAAMSSLDSVTALRGVRALAGLALLKQRWSFLIPGGELDVERINESLDATHVVGDWEPAHLQALLRLPLFDEGSYGRVRLHHRIVHEYLAAQWLNELLDHGWPYHDLEGLLFRRSAVGSTVPGHLRPVAAWLAAWRSSLADRLISEAPELLLLYGDSSRLSDTTRRAALSAFADSYADRKATGRRFGAASLRRFACPALAPLVSELLGDRARSPELRTTLLDLVAHGLAASVDQALEIACCHDESDALRAKAIAAVAAVGDQTHQHKLLLALHADSPQKLVAAAMSTLYPKSLGAAGLVDLALRARSPSLYSYREAVWAWKNLLRVASHEERHALLGSLNARLEELLLPGVSPDDLWAFEFLAHTVALVLSDHIAPADDVFAPELEQALELLRLASSEPWYLTVDPEVAAALSARPLLRRRLFWLSVAARSQGKVQLDSWRSLPYRRELWEPNSSDIEWLSADALGERSLPERLLAFDTLRRGLMDLQSLDALAAREGAFAEHLHALEEESRRRGEHPAILELRAVEQTKRQERERIQDANRQMLEESVETIRDGTNIPLLAHLFGVSERSPRSYGYVSTAPLRDIYGAGVAEAAESGWRAFWRRHTPQLRHERMNANEIKYEDILGLVGVTLELTSAAAPQEWTHEEAALAARYACVELNGLPEWLEAVAAAHPRAVRDGIEAALLSEYSQPSDGSNSSPLIGSLTRSGPAVLAVLGPVVSDCLRNSVPGSAAAATSCLELAAHAPEACEPPPLDVVYARCRASVGSAEHCSAWMQHWLARDPEAAVEALVEIIRDPVPLQSSPPRMDAATHDISMMQPPASAEERPARANELVTTLLARIHECRLDSQNGVAASLRSSPVALLRLLLLVYRYVPKSEDNEEESLEFKLVTPLAAAQGARDHLLSLALHPEQGLSTEQLRLLADDPSMKAVKDAILVAVDYRATREVARESTGIEAALTKLYRQHGTGALEHLRRSREPAAVTPENLLHDLVAVGQSLIEQSAVLPETEDAISDWLLGMLRHRLDARGVEVGDQARGGLSASKRGAGERDAVLRHQGRIVGVFEAFRMSSCASKTITSHLDKLPGYNLVGAGLYVAVYYQGSSFDDWVAKYKAVIEKHPIQGWKARNQRTDYTIDDLGVAQRVLRLAYDTQSGEQVIFHVLLDLGRIRGKRGSSQKDTGRRERGSANRPR